MVSSRSVVFLLLFLSGVSVCHAQVSVEEDWLSTSAWISEHKKVSSILLARSIVETATKVLHEDSEQQMKAYRDVNEELDRYTKCFDIIDIIFTSGQTVVNVYTTYNDVKDCVEDLSGLVNDYRKLCLGRGDIMSSDSIIFTESARIVSLVLEEADCMKKTVVSMAAYATGQLHCTRAEFLQMIVTLNDCLYNIREIVNRGYLTLSRYIFNRTHYWKKDLYQARSAKEMARDALGRWLESGVRGSRINY